MRTRLINLPSILMVIVLVSSVMGNAYAQSLSPTEVVSEIRRIASISDDSARLKAFDALAARLPMPIDPEKEAAGAGNWRVTEDRSKIDDTRTVVLVLPAEDEVRGWPNKTTRPSLVVRYQEGKLQCYIALGVTPSVESIDGATITVRFDDKEASDIRCSLSTDREAVFLPDAKAFIRDIANSQRMILRFVPFNSNPVVTEFDTRGFRIAVEPLGPV